MPKIVKLSKFGRWCEAKGLSRSDVENLTGFSQTYVSQLFTGRKKLSSYFTKFFYSWWGVVFPDSIKKTMLKTPKQNTQRTRS
jgi:transcriptional regulator with XRE-family HTH domain